MTGWNMKTLLNALGEEVLEVHGNSGVVFGEISTDSRRITKNCIFIAIRGENFDGHDFVAQAAQAGAGVAVAERSLGMITAWTPAASAERRQAPKFLGSVIPSKIKKSESG